MEVFVFVTIHVTFPIKIQLKISMRIPQSSESQEYHMGSCKLEWIQMHLKLKLKKKSI